ncbi:putative protein SirB1 [Dioscorea sansibarensis]
MSSLISSMVAGRSLLRYDDGGKKAWRARAQRWSRPTSRAAHTLCSLAMVPKDPKLEIQKAARQRFVREISFKSKDKDVALAKALLYVAAEDEAFISYSRDRDAYAFAREREDAPIPFKAQLEVDSVEEFPLAGKTISGWLDELEMIAKEVQAELVSRDIGCHLVEVLKAVNVVLFESRDFKRFLALTEPKFCYLHTALNSGCGSAILLSIIYIEICQRLGITIVGSCVGEDFLIWPDSGNLEELFKVSSGHSLFAIINGKCVENPRSKASDLDGRSLLQLDIATNRDIIGIALANLIRLHWKRASRSAHGLMLTSPLRSIHGSGNPNTADSSMAPLLRPRDLRLAIMASERLLILQPHNWSLRRDLGMLLYYSKRYGEAVQELSICMAFAPVEEAEVLEPFVEKLHLLRFEQSWNSQEQTGSLMVP